MQPDLFRSQILHHVIYDDSLLSIAPAPEGIEEILKYTEKKMEEVKEPGARFARRVTRYYKVDMFKYTSTAPYKVLQTFAPFQMSPQSWLSLV